MTNKFLKVNKDLFFLKLNPVELLILSQVMEFNTNTGDCFISDCALAKQFGVSESTIKRAIKRLVDDLGYITRETTNVKGGKERHMKVNLKKIEEDITKAKLSLDDSQSSNCSLTSVNLSFDKEHFDTIKDNLQDKEKDNIGEVETPYARFARCGMVSTSLEEGPGEGKAFNELSKSEKMEQFKREYGF